MFSLGESVSSVEAQVAVSVVIALAAMAGAYFVQRLRQRLADKIAPLAVDLIGSAISIAIVVGALFAIIDLWGQTESVVEQFGHLEFEERAPLIAVTIVVLVAIQVFTSVARRLLDDVTQESDAMSEHEREISYRLTQIVLWTVGIIFILGVWEINLGGLLIGAGFLGIVVGFAARQTLGAALSGFVLMFSRPFEVGDWIGVGEGAEEAEGIVTDITLMNTRIQAFDGEFVMVPNDVIGNRMVKNRSRKGRLRMEVEVGVDYEADVEHAREIATEAVSEIDMIMSVPRAETVVKEFDDSSVTLGVRGWIEHPSSRRRWRARTRMIRNVKNRFAEEGVKIPFPQRELTGREEQGGFRVMGEPAAAGPADDTERRSESERDGQGSNGSDEESDDATSTSDRDATGTDGEGTDGTGSESSDGTDDEEEWPAEDAAEEDDTVAADDESSASNDRG
ncbi:mechanosensitive ion channel family protein [Salinarchaeum laminariae]|uniref:mechanosensitive ion channel family protein n=1 Tax=Salinarchaeum laminariae TaxID=869888 RepID=UPI0020C10474|nr:mechanosensitive ion channel family protein [Salinarchaeum laminariae]